MKSLWMDNSFFFSALVRDDEYSEMFKLHQTGCKGGDSVQPQLDSEHRLQVCAVANELNSQKVTQRPR